MSSVWGTGRIADGINWSTHKMYPYPKHLILLKFNVLNPNMALELNSWL